MKWKSRTENLLGNESVVKLSEKSVLIVGLGGVGGYAFESIVRCGVGKITVCDGDVFDESNLNRQLLSTSDCIGKSKAEIAKMRALAINPDVDIIVRNCRFNADTANEILSCKFDYIVDCIDSVSDKILLIKLANEKNMPCISALGTANRTDIMFEVADIYDTKYDRLARAVRRELKQLNIANHKVVYSKQEPHVVSSTLGSIVFPPAICGITLGREVIFDLLKEKTNEI